MEGQLHARNGPKCSTHIYSVQHHNSTPGRCCFHLHFANEAMEAGVEVPKVTQLIRGKAQLLAPKTLMQIHVSCYVVSTPVHEQ